MTQNSSAASYLDTVSKNPTNLISKILSSASDQPENNVTSNLSGLVKEILDPVILINKDRSNGKDTILDQIYVDGLDSSQVWEQAKLVIDRNIDELMFGDIPDIKEKMGGSDGQGSEFSGSEQSVSGDEFSSDEEGEFPAEDEKEEEEEGLVDQNVSDDEYEDYKRPQDSESDVEEEEDSEGDEGTATTENIVEQGEDHEEELDEEENQQSKDKFGLNDEFFSLDNFNKEILAHEEKDDFIDEDEEEVDYFGEVSDGSDEEAEYYDDFFDNPNKKSSKSEKQKPKAKKSKADKDEEEESEFGEEEYENAMTNTMLDLFADDDGNAKSKSKKESLSTYEKQQRQIQKQIANLEREAVEEKKWTMKGESSVKNRPTDALLDEELEFDRNAKPVPVITKEVTESIEDLIRRRIKNYEFDDLPRRLYSDVTKDRFKFKDDFNIEEVGKKSQKSLAEIYEDEHYKGTTSEAVKNDELKAKHDEIIQSFQMLSYKLDSLCSAHYIPRPATKSLEIKVNTSTIQMEDAQPLALASESTLAPQEVFKVEDGVDRATNEVKLANGMVISKDELTPEQRKALRRKNKRKQKVSGKEREAKKARKAKDSQSDVLQTLKKANVQVIDSKGGARKDMDGRVVKDGGKSKSVAFKL